MESPVSRRKVLQLTNKPAARPVSDSSKLLYHDIMTPVQAALETHQQFAGQVQQQVAKRMATLDNIELSEGWQLDVQAMRWLQTPPPKG